jgi:hypothetical protein
VYLICVHFDSSSETKASSNYEISLLLLNVMSFLAENVSTTFRCSMEIGKDIDVICMDDSFNVLTLTK